MNILKQMADAVRIAFGWGSLSETRPSPAHGWLLRNPSQPRLVPVPVPMDKTGPR